MTKILYQNRSIVFYFTVTIYIMIYTSRLFWSFLTFQEYETAVTLRATRIQYTDGHFDIHKCVYVTIQGL